MNKREREVQQVHLNNEKAVLKELENSYKDALKQINKKLEALMARQDADMAHVIYQIEYQKNLKTQVQSILEELHTKEFETLSEFLSGSYEDGFIGTMYNLHGQGIEMILPIDPEQMIEAIQHETKLSESLYESLGVDVKDLQKKISGEISRGIASGMAYADIARNISAVSNIPKNRAMTIARTESHRIQNKASYNASTTAKSKGADIVKMWDSALDKLTRTTHRQLDGQIRELDEPFEIGGKKAMYPGEFGDPAEDVNCRCAYISRARSRLDQNRTKWSEEASILSDGKEPLVVIEAKNYEEYKSKFKKADNAITKQKRKPPNEELGVKREAVAEHMKSLGAEVDEDGNVTLYHATDKANVSKIKENGFKPTEAPVNGGTGGEEIEPRVFFGYDKKWIEETWSSDGNYEIIEVKIPAEYIHQFGQNTQEVVVEGTIKIQDDDIWIPEILPTSTAWDRKTIKRWLKKKQ